MILLAVLLIFGCISDSWERCFDYHCAHHTDLPGCVRGNYICQAHEFCETTTKAHSNSRNNAPWVDMHCRPKEEMVNCWASQASNPPSCDPSHHDIICHYCCDTEQCMHDLARGIIPQQGATSAPAQTTPAVVSTTTTTTVPVTVTTTTVPTVTVPVTTAEGSMVTGTPGDTGGVCADLYLGDCVADFAGRCSEPLVVQLCPKTCNACG